MRAKAWRMVDCLPAAMSAIVCLRRREAAAEGRQMESSGMEGRRGGSGEEEEGTGRV